MKRLLYSLPGCLLLFSAALATPQPLSAAPKTVKQRPATIYTQSEFKLSKERMTTINTILDNVIKRNFDVRKASTISMIEAEIASKMVLVPRVPVSNKTISQFAAEARKLVRDNVAYTAELANLRATAEKEAAEKYPLAKPRTKVSFEYQKGPYIEKVEGIFFAASDRFVQVNDKRVAYVDLPDKLRSQFDRKFNAEKRQAYIDGKIRELEDRKNVEVQETFTKLLAGQDLLNEKNGYIYDRSVKQWITAKDYLNSQLPAAVEKYDKYQAQQKAKQQAAKELAAERAKAAAQTQTNASVDTTDEERYKNALKDARKQCSEVRAKYSGVDAYQGYRYAHWGISRENVAFLFSRTQGARFEYVEFNGKLVLPKYFPAEVFFHFDNDKLDKVVIDYGFLPKRQGTDAEKSDIKRIFRSDDFNNLVISLHDLCGDSDEEKAAKNKNIFKEIASGTMTPNDLHPSQDKEIHTLDFSFTWSGKISEMTLTFRYDKTNNVYQNVQLTKSLKK